MPYIYKITNNLNNKIYIGKTNQTISKRWSEHCKDKDRFLDRPLYRAMNKYGIENFSITEIEYVDTDLMAQEREKYWIEYFGSFKYGYNATIGGDGRTYIDYDLVCKLYNELQSCILVAQNLSISVDSVSNILHAHNIKVLSGQDHAKLQNSKLVSMYDMHHNLIKVFSSMNDAGRYLQDNGIAKGAIEGIRSHIRQVCQGKRNLAYGYIWEW